MFSLLCYSAVGDTAASDILPDTRWVSVEMTRPMNQ